MNSATRASATMCQHCGSEFPHQGQCPRIKAIEYDSSGFVKKIEYFSPNEIMYPYHQPPTMQPSPPCPWSPNMMNIPLENIHSTFNVKGKIE